MSETSEHMPRFIAVATTMIALSGGATMLGILLWSGEMGRGPWLEALGAFVLPAIIGAALAGLPTASLFGRNGGAGWMLALLGALIATAIGSLIGGAIFVGVVGGGNPADAIYAPLVVFFSLATPVTGPLWGATMVATHLVSRRLRENW